MGRRSKFEPSFKAKVALEAAKEQKTLSELAKEFGVSPAKISEWKEELLQNAGAAFINPDESQDKAVRKLKSEKERLLKKVGELTLENDFFASACEDAGLKVR
ncbi:MAG: transposase [Prevotella sp.]|jgi:transposase|nr:transposase [Prevotella sp.]MCH3995246.1 transposase [Prevotella sp.]MCH3995385.1 transposase [Prevotella sp.]MCH3995520.1 transposase [Prevotella sp.]MCH3996016.1 transposase [Prevotella sp.]